MTTKENVEDQEQKLEKQIQKQMGCMAGFMHMFDRHHLFTGKRLSPSKVDSTPEPEISDGSPEKDTDQPELRSPMPETKQTASTEAVPAKSPRTPPAFELKEGRTRPASWKFRESPRLSLDSRATVDAKGSLSRRQLRTNAEIENSGDGSGADEGEKQRRSTGVIARLMGLELDSNPIRIPEPGAKSELRRSASESRVCRDLFQSRRLLEGSRFQAKQTQLQLQQQSIAGINANGNGIATRNSNNSISKLSTTNEARKRGQEKYPMEHQYSKAESPKAVQRGGAFPGGSCSSPMKLPQQRKRFDSGDIFPGPRQSMGGSYGETEPPSRDLETLKQILEGLHLKGLLHHHPKGLLNSEEHIVVMRPSRSMSPIRSTPRIRNDVPPSGFKSKSPRSRRNMSHHVEIHPPASFRTATAQIDRSARNPSHRARDSNSPTRSDSSAKSSNSLTPRAKALHVETRRKPNETADHRRASPANSPRSCCRAAGGSSPTVSRSPRYNKPKPAEIQQKAKIPVPIQTEDESSSVSDGSSLSTSSHTDSEVQRAKEGRSLLERCDKLLHSIAEITTTELQPSPVSVLDSSFYKDESSPSPSPVMMKRSIDFREEAAETEDQFWSPEQAEERLDDRDFVYVSEIVGALNYFPKDSDVFDLVEKQRLMKGQNGGFPMPKLHRKLVFDAVNEIVDKRRPRFPPWKAAVSCSHWVIARPPQVQEIWAEYRRIRDTDALSEDSSEAIAGGGWGDWQSLTSELVLDIERQVFKDLISETIQSSAAASSGGCRRSDEECCGVPRRKLAF